jgi:hypothetical protein
MLFREWNFTEYFFSVHGRLLYRRPFFSVIMIALLFSAIYLCQLLHMWLMMNEDILLCSQLFEVFFTVACNNFYSYCHVQGWLWTGFWSRLLHLLHLIHSQLRTTGNYSAIAHQYTLQFTVTHTLGFSIFTNPILGTDFNSLTLQMLLYYSAQVSTSQPTSFLHNCTADSQLSVGLGSSLYSLGTDPTETPFPSNIRCLQGQCLATGLYDTCGLL